MKVFVLTYNQGSIDEGSETKVIGVFESQEAAEKKADETKKSDRFFCERWDYTEITEHEVQ